MTGAAISLLISLLNPAFGNEFAPVASTAMSLPGFLSTLEPATACNQATPTSSACSNFWEHSCRELGEDAPYKDGSVRAARRYNELIDRELASRGFFEPLTRRITLFPSTVFTRDSLSTLRNLDRLIDGKGASAAVAELRRTLLPDGAVMPCNGDSMNFFRNQVAKQLGGGAGPAAERLRLRYGVNRTGQDLRAELGNLLSDLAQRRQGADLIDSLKELITACFMDEYNELESAVSTQIARKRIFAALHPPEEVAQVHAMFRETQGLFNEHLAALGATPDLARMSAVRLVYPPPVPPLADLRRHMIGGNAEYRSFKGSEIFNDVVLYGSFDGNPGNFVSTLAHELGHAISSDKLAERFLLDPIFTVSPELASRNAEIRNCLMQPNALGLGETQSNEAIADFYSAEIFAVYLERQRPPLDIAQKRSHALNWVTACDAPDRNPRLPHPPLDLRANRIFMAHPAIRNLFGCALTDDPKYCGKGGP